MKLPIRTKVKIQERHGLTNTSLIVTRGLIACFAFASERGAFVDAVAFSAHIAAHPVTHAVLPTRVLSPVDRLRPRVRVRAPFVRHETTRFAWHASKPALVPLVVGQTGAPVSGRLIMAVPALTLGFIMLAEVVQASSQLRRFLFHC